MKNPYTETVARLGTLETFDAKAFVGDTTCPQQLCDLIVSLSLVYNDVRDLMVAYMCLEPVMPAQGSKPSPAVGNISGISIHLLRLFAGVIHETLNLIKDNCVVLDVPIFREVIRKIHPEARDAWLSLVAAAQNKPTADPLTKMLLFARNKVSFHYDRKEIARGYAIAFLENQTREPYVSRGDSMAETRFYFADAAAHEYLQIAGDAAAAKVFLGARSKVFHQVNHALREVVVAFITTRKFGWREPKSGAT